MQFPQTSSYKFGLIISILKRTSTKTPRSNLRAREGMSSVEWTTFDNLQTYTTSNRARVLKIKCAEMTKCLIRHAKLQHVFINQSLIIYVRCATRQLLYACQSFHAKKKDRPIVLAHKCKITAAVGQSNNGHRPLLRYKTHLMFPSRCVVQISRNCLRLSGMRLA